MEQNQLLLAIYKNQEDILHQMKEINQKIDRLQRKPIKQLIKSFVSPKIGVLYHHRPKKLKLPTTYEKNITLTSTPSISIVTPCFNQDHFIERTILSVLNQDYPKLEYIIQDGGSTDRCPDIIQSYKNSLTHWESRKDNGQSHAINLGFQHATGDIMAYLNSDDILLPGTLKYVADYFTKHPEVDVIYGHRVLIDEFDQEIGRWILPRHDNAVLSWADYVPQETLFWRRSIWDKAGGKIDEDFKFAMDWDLILRFRESGAKFARLPRFLGAFRVHIHQKTSAAITKTGVEEMERLRMRCHHRKVSPREITQHIKLYKLKHLIHNHLYRAGILRY